MPYLKFYYQIDFQIMKDPVDLLKQKLETITTNGNDPTCVTYVINEEDDTLGNALRYVIASYKEVELCQYTRPHPTEDCIHFRIQTYGKTPGKLLCVIHSSLLNPLQLWRF